MDHWIKSGKIIFIFNPVIKMELYAIHAEDWYLEPEQWWQIIFFFKSLDALLVVCGLTWNFLLFDWITSFFLNRPYKFMER